MKRSKKIIAVIIFCFIGFIILKAFFPKSLFFGIIILMAIFIPKKKNGAKKINPPNKLTDFTPPSTPPPPIPNRKVYQNSEHLHPTNPRDTFTQEHIKYCDDEDVVFADDSFQKAFYQASEKGKDFDPWDLSPEKNNWDL